ncbi:hypothetical protein AAKU64_004570 [Undibacterium sp. GrIS 1.8]|uniref:hypothetical protein n=1 Tax=unclassified Undibacterium TaxID=2630295 RepID=UPI003394DACA
MNVLLRVTLSSLMVLCAAISSFASAQTEREMAEMQRKLNAEVMEKPFSVADEAKVDAFIKDAMAKNLKPVETKAPAHWQNGYTCADIYQYGWSGYQNCRYYHHYYGRYW